MAKARRDLTTVAGSPDTGAAAAAGRSRHGMRADWDRVRAMLEGPRARRAPDGRDVFEVWADLVLANPPVEYERAARLFPAAAVDKGEGSGGLGDIRDLYLIAVQGANKQPDPRVIEGTSGVQPELTDW